MAYASTIVVRPRNLRSKRLRDNIVMFSFAMPATRLSSAERTIALQILLGWSNARIARARGVSTRTIANQIASLLKRTGVTSRTELAGRFSATDLLGT